MADPELSTLSRGASTVSTDAMVAGGAGKRRATILAASHPHHSRATKAVMHNATLRFLLMAWILLAGGVSVIWAQEDDKTLRVFIFAGQSNMVGSDSKVSDIERFPPFEGLEDPQRAVLYSYCIGREDKRRSDGWDSLQPVNKVVGPELSFARSVSESIDAPIAVIKIAAGGTHLGGDWNPDTPSGFEMYPLALEWVRSALADLDKKRISYRIEGFMWHQGENDMFNEDYMESYGKNLANFLRCWRRDLETPDLQFYIGELCTKTIWGMDLRPRMYAISLGQREVTSSDPLAAFVPTSHVGVEIGGGVGLHYHYGTLGQLEHGINYAQAYLASIGKLQSHERPPRGLALHQRGHRETLRLTRTPEYGGRAGLHPGAEDPQREEQAAQEQSPYCLSLQHRRRVQGVR